MSKQSGKNVWEFVMVDRKGCLLVCYDIWLGQKLYTEKSPTCGWMGDYLISYSTTSISS